MNEIQINGEFYIIGKLDAMRQFHVMRRIAPIMAAVGGPVFDALSSGAKPNVDMLFALAAGPFADVVAKMSNEDSEYVIMTCLSVVQKRQANGIAPLVRAGQLMFADLDMKTMMRLVFETLRGNMSDFFPKLPEDSNSSPAS